MKDFMKTLAAAVVVGVVIGVIGALAIWIGA